MAVIQQKKDFIALLAIFAMLPVALVGCGDSQGVETLTGCLSDYSELIENYKASVGKDKSKQAEWDAKVAALTAKWIAIRNEFGSDITPQHMEKMVQQYESLVLSLTNFKKTIGS